MSGLRTSRPVRAVAERLPAPLRELAKGVLVRWPKPIWGNMRRGRPFSVVWGFDRGTPVDRVFVERFLGRHAADVRGRVLEVRDARYTRRFGGAAVTESTILDVDPANPTATLVADLGRPGSLPAGSFDCIVLTQVLQYVPAVDAALANVAQALAPGGVAFVTVPGISPVDVRADPPDLLRWTPTGFRAEVERSCPGLESAVEGAGGLTAAIAFLHGLSGEELRRSDLEAHDDRFSVVVCARLRKP